MFRHGLRRTSRCTSFPRVRGDVPEIDLPNRRWNLFSPRARGCSLIFDPSSAYNNVFPACAGMFPTQNIIVIAMMSFPRVRGDVPRGVLLSAPKSLFSPRARGCSFARAYGNRRTTVFPACAGMFRSRATRVTWYSRFPRVRGDVPRMPRRPQQPPGFSPRARGCSALHQLGGGPQRVFPACAGMFLCEHKPRSGWLGFPRVRGDVPCPAFYRFKIKSFSPRARGCSFRHQGTCPRCSVFPACAGMFLVVVHCQHLLASFPRVRGDVPIDIVDGQKARRFSPRARGCSRYRPPFLGFRTVFPACAGMFPVQFPWHRACHCFPRVRGDVPS